MMNASDIYLKLNQLCHTANLEMSISDIHVLVHGCQEISFVGYVLDEFDTHIKYCLVVPEYFCTGEVSEKLLDATLITQLVHISWAQDKKFVSGPGYVYYDGKLYDISKFPVGAVIGVWMYDLGVILKQANVGDFTRDEHEEFMQLQIQNCGRKPDHIPEFLLGKYLVNIEDLNSYIKSNEFEIRLISDKPYLVE